MRDVEGKSTLRTRGVHWWIMRLVSRSTGTSLPAYSPCSSLARAVSQFAHRTIHDGVVSGTHNLGDEHLHGARAESALL